MSTLYASCSINGDSMNKPNNKFNKAVKGTGIAVKVMLVLCGIAIAAFLAWIGYNIYSMFGV